MLHVALVIGDKCDVDMYMTYNDHPISLSHHVVHV